MKNKKRSKKIGCIVVVLLIFCISHLATESCGDVNSDGIIDILDALLIAQHYVGLEPENFDENAADVNGDGAIDILDALLVARFYVGLIPELPGCTETPTPTPEGGTTTYELQAEDESWSSGGVDTNHSGYTGTGFVNTDNSSGEWIEWSFDLSADSTAECVFRYACEGDARTMDLSINGGAGTNLPFPASGAWNIWATQATDTVTLSAGLVTIRVTATTSGGPPNMDKMDITITGGVIVAPTETPEPTETPVPTPTPTCDGTCPPVPDRLRVMMSSDIGGTDNDDQQSMVHFLVYTDLWDVEGLISSPWGGGRASDIHECIDAYEADYSNLVSHSSDYPTPDYLRSVTKQGEIDKAPSQGYRQPTEGSEWIAEVAMRDDPRPLWLTVWGGIEDLAQALHDHPEIESRLRVYWIAGPNRRNSPDASEYIADNHKNLWIIEADETYRGFFNGGDMSGDLSNDEFPRQHIDGHGELGEYFMSHRSDIKMGDTPAVLYTIDNEIRNPGDPTQPGWGGAFIPHGGDRPFCWLDDPSQSSEGYDGAATVNIHREAFLRDFQARMDRSQSPR